MDSSLVSQPPPAAPASDVTASDATAASARRGPFGLPMSMLFVLCLYGAVALLIAFTARFPSQIDELHHLSVIRAQYEHPTLFPDWSRYVLLRRDDLTQWSAVPNYINHPSLYYLLLAPLMALTADPLVLRLVNVLMSTLALSIVLVAARRRFGDDVLSPLIFSVIAASFPKAAVVGGMVNNDNLAAIAAAALFGGMLGLRARGWWIMAGLALAGWAKLTAFIALAAVGGAWLAIELLAGRVRLRDRLVLLACAGVVIGALPYIVTLLRTGAPLWVNEAAWRVPLAQRAHLDLAGFAMRFLDTLVQKWPASEAVYPLPLALAGLLTPLLLAGIGMRARVIGTVGIAYAVGLVVLFAVHFGFGWRSFLALGDLTIMQARYYGVLWPGIALSAAIAATRLARRWSLIRPAVILICLSPTALGALLYVSF